MSLDQKVMILLTQWRNTLRTSIQESFLLPKFDNSSPSATRDREICQSIVIMRYDVTSFLGRRLNWTLWMRLTWCPNLLFLASPRLERYRFSNRSFWAVQSVKLFCWLWLSQNWPYSLILVMLGKSQFILLSLGKMLDCEKQSKPPLLDKKFRVWHKSFSMIQSARIKNWVSQLLRRLQRFNLSLLSVTRFSDLSDKIKYVW